MVIAIYSSSFLSSLLFILSVFSLFYILYFVVLESLSLLPTYILTQSSHCIVDLHRLVFPVILWASAFSYTITSTCPADYSHLPITSTCPADYSGHTRGHTRIHRTNAYTSGHTGHSQTHTDTRVHTWLHVLHSVTRGKTWKHANTRGHTRTHPCRDHSL